MILRRTLLLGFVRCGKEQVQTKDHPNDTHKVPRCSAYGPNYEDCYAPPCFSLTTHRRVGLEQFSNPAPETMFFEDVENDYAKYQETDHATFRNQWRSSSIVRIL